MKKFCSIFSRLLEFIIKKNLSPLNQTKIGFQLDSHYEGLEFDSVHKRNIQENYDF